MFAGLGNSTYGVELSIDGISTSSLYEWAGSGYLHLENMNLTELPAGVFDGLEHLNLFLSLQGNKLRTLPAGLFRHLSSLEKLDLQGNGLRTLPEGLFRHLSSLEKLDLQGNGLRTLPEGLFRNLSSLEKLDLQGNKLRTLPAGLLWNLRSLRYLYLQNNGLEELPSRVSAWNHVDLIFPQQWSLPFGVSVKVWAGLHRVPEVGIFWKVGESGSQKFGGSLEGAGVVISCLSWVKWRVAEEWGWEKVLGVPKPFWKVPEVFLTLQEFRRALWRVPENASAGSRIWMNSKGSEEMAQCLTGSGGPRSIQNVD